MSATATLHPLTRAFDIVPLRPDDSAPPCPAGIDPQLWALAYEFGPDIAPGTWAHALRHAWIDRRRLRFDLSRLAKALYGPESHADDCIERERRRIRAILDGFGVPVQRYSTADWTGPLGLLADLEWRIERVGEAKFPRWPSDILLAVEYAEKGYSPEAIAVRFFPLRRPETIRRALEEHYRQSVAQQGRTA